MAKVAHPEDTIAAIATPLGSGAVGIVRLSGACSIAIVDKIFSAKNKKSLTAMASFSFRYGWIVDDQGKVVDEVIVSLMRGPRSFTKEDVVEINAHGGSCALAAILKLVLIHGARLAQPGEFTKRAFLNGRLDLVQAEAVLDVIQAKGDLALKVSVSQLSGDISRELGHMREILLGVLADIEGHIDFSEEEVGGIVLKELHTKISRLLRKINEMLEKSFEGKIIREGLKVVIYGRPNVGKSSLLNALLKKERAIVTSIAGTTRDTIEEYISMKGLAVHLIDTAGILESRDAIEEEALARTNKALQEADLVLFVVDASASLTPEDKMLADKVGQKRCVVVMNKADQKHRVSARAIRDVLSHEPIEVSALTGQHIDKLEDAIVAGVFTNGHVGQESVVVSNARHIEILRRVQHHLELSCDTLKKGLSLEFVAMDAGKALGALGELTGEVFNEDILEVIFSKFCIGK